MTEPPNPPPYPPSDDPYGYGPYYGQPQPDPGQPYPGGPPTGWGAPAPGNARPRPSTLGQRLGARSFRRPEPRLSIVLAGAGGALVLVGLLIWAGRFYTSSGLGSSRKYVAGLIFLAIAVAGHLLAISQKRGALATAGTVTGAFAVPVAFGFLTVDAGGALRTGYPFSVDAVLLLSVLAWTLDYFFVPGLRGRAVLLSAGATGIFLWVAVKAGGDRAVSSASAVVFGAPGVGDAGPITAVGLIFGLGYYVVAAFLDRRGRAGAAVAMVVAGFYATLGGVAAGAADMGRGGTGALLIFLGTGLAWYGARFGRRFTAWAWGAAVVLGFGLVVSEVFSDSATAAGIALFIGGLLVIAAAYGIAVATREAPDVEEVPAPAV